MPDPTLDSGIVDAGGDHRAQAHQRPVVEGSAQSSSCGTIDGEKRAHQRRQADAALRVIGEYEGDAAVVAKGRGRERGSSGKLLSGAPVLDRNLRKVVIFNHNLLSTYEES